MVPFAVAWVSQVAIRSAKRLAVFAPTYRGGGVRTSAALGLLSLPWRCRGPATADICRQECIHTEMAMGEWSSVGGTGRCGNAAGSVSNLSRAVDEATDVPGTDRDAWRIWTIRRKLFI